MKVNNDASRHDKQTVSSQDGYSTVALTLSWGDMREALQDWLAKWGNTPNAQVYDIERRNDQFDGWRITATWPNTRGS